MKFELYKDSGNFFRWRLKGANGEIVAISSEGYSSKQNAINSIILVRSSSVADVVDLT